MEEDDIPVINVTPNNELEEKIAKIAALFDFTGTNSVQCNKLGSILRLLGCAPSERDVRKMCKEIAFEEAPEYISINTLIGHVGEMIIQQKMKPASSDQLLQAFKNLDTEDSGFIDVEYFKKVMLTEGEPLAEDEVDCMIKEAIDPVVGQINYEFYLNKLVDYDLVLYKLGEEIKKERLIEDEVTNDEETEKAEID